MDRYVTDIKNGCYQNPVLPMDFSDPDAIRVGEDYYLISSSFTYLPGVPVLHSKDLVHWERIGNCVERLPFDRYAQPAHGCGTWAPALRYHAGRFYAFIPLPDEGIFYTEATDPAGPWSALHCVKSASGWIDPCPLWDDDGSVYMAHAFAKSRCGIKHKIQLSRLDPETLEVVEDGPIVFDGTLSQPTAEGPKMYSATAGITSLSRQAVWNTAGRPCCAPAMCTARMRKKSSCTRGPAPSTAPTRARGSQRRTAAIGSCISRTGLNWAAWYTCSLCAGTAIGRSSAWNKTAMASASR